MTQSHSPLKHKREKSSQRGLALQPTNLIIRSEESLLMQSDERKESEVSIDLTKSGNRSDWQNNSARLSQNALFYSNVKLMWQSDNVSSSQPSPFSGSLHSSTRMYTAEEIEAIKQAKRL